MGSSHINVHLGLSQFSGMVHYQSQTGSLQVYPHTGAGAYDKLKIILRITTQLVVHFGSLHYVMHLGQSSVEQASSGHLISHSGLGQITSHCDFPTCSHL